MVEQLGMARKVTVGSTNTTLIADGASRDEIEMRVAQLKKVKREGGCVGDDGPVEETASQFVVCGEMHVVRLVELNEGRVSFYSQEGN